MDAAAYFGGPAADLAFRRGWTHGILALALWPFVLTGAVLLLDGWAMLTRSELLAGEEALRRWMNAAALARPAGQGGRVVVMAPAAVPVIQALVRWDDPARGPVSPGCSGQGLPG